MTAVRDLLRRADDHGISFRLDGDGEVRMSAPAAPPADLLAELRSYKADIVSTLSGEWTAEDWMAFYDERAGIAEHDGGMSRHEAEAAAFESCIVEWLRRHPQLSRPFDGCAECRQPQSDGECTDHDYHRNAHTARQTRHVPH